MFKLECDSRLQSLLARRTQGFEVPRPSDDETLRAIHANVPQYLDDRPTLSHSALVCFPIT